MAFAVLELDHTPPLPVVVKMVVAPTHTEEAPETVPALGCGFTVIDLVTVAEPQPLVTI